jgi:hypothetical protein
MQLYGTPEKKRGNLKKGAIMGYITRTFLLAALIAATSVSLLAQRGFGHGSVAPPSAAGLRGISPGGHPISVPRNYPAPLGLRAPAAGYTGIRPGALRSRGDYRRVPYAYFAAPYYYPFLDYGSAPYGGAPYDVPPDDPNAQTAMMAENALGAQVQRLTNEVDQLRYGQQLQGSQFQQQDSQPPPVPVTLVLRNGQQLQVQNYAVMNQTFWDFSSQPTRRIPLASIDIPASTQATQAKGGEFPSIDSMQ